MLPLMLMSGWLMAQAQAAPKVVKRPAQAPAPSLRCGWLDNPTPGNVYLRDRERAWTVAEQGGYQAKGVDLIPDLSGDEFVEQNGHHGYACVCLAATVDRRTERVVEIFRVTPKLLKVCLEDPQLAPMPHAG